MSLRQSRCRYSHIEDKKMFSNGISFEQSKFFVLFFLCLITQIKNNITTNITMYSTHYRLPLREDYMGDVGNVGAHGSIFRQLNQYVLSSLVARFKSLVLLFCPFQT